MKRILLISMLLVSINAIGQITSASYTNKGATVPFINSSSYKLNGVAKEFSQWTTNGANIYYTSGYVGIGTTAPGSPLNVAANGRCASFWSNGTANKNGVSFDNPNLNASQIYSNYTGTNPEQAFILGTYSNRANQIYMATSGNVGIGLTSPTSKLTVSGGISADTITTKWYYQKPDDVGEIFKIDNVDSKNVFLIDDEQKFITLGNYVGSAYNIGVKKFPTYPLDINGITRSKGIINDSTYFQNVANNRFTLFDNTYNDSTFTVKKNVARFGTGEYEVFVGVNNSNPVHQLDVNGTIKTSGNIYHQGIFAEIYCADASTAQSIPTGTTYTKLTHWTTNGESQNCTADASNDKITITKTGYYEITATSSSSASTTGVAFRFSIFAGGTEISKIHSWSKFANSSDKRSGSIHGIYHATSVPVDIDVRARHGEAGSVNLTIVYSNMTVKYIGE